MAYRCLGRALLVQRADSLLVSETKSRVDLGLVLGPMVAFKKGNMARTFTFIRVSTPRPELT